MLREEYVPIKMAVKEIGIPGVTYEYIRKGCRKGLPFIRPGKLTLVRVSDVEDYVKNQSARASEPATKTTRINDSIKRLKKRRIG